MTPAQRERRIRDLAARRARLEAEVRQIDLQAGPIEREHSRSLGYTFPPLRGAKLLEVMDRAGRVAA